MRPVFVFGLGLALVMVACGGDDGTATTDLPSLPATTTTTSVSTTSSSSPPAATTTTTTLAPLQGVDVELVADGFDSAVWVGPDPGTGGLLVLERRGRILGIDGGVRFDIDARVGSGSSEQGLLGLAFHPDDADKFYVNYTDTGGDTVVSEFRRVDGVMDPSTERVLFEVAQPASNHNGGNLEFGPDGMLYVGMGDGGASNDRFGNGQDPFTRLGSMLRLDPAPSGDLPYTVPADNPLAGGEDGDPLVYAIGLRNPWRFTFDGAALYVADVGQGDWEEVSVVPADPFFADNFGWPVLEGSNCFMASSCDRSAGTTADGSPVDMIQPVVEYSHAEGCSITGGVVMHDPTIPELDGFYVYGDFCTGFVRGFFGPAGTGQSELLTGVGSISSFGVDTDGSVLVVTLSGSIWRIVPLR